MSRSMGLLMAPVLAVIIGACREPTVASPSPAQAPPVVTEPWLRTASAGGTTAAYMRLSNLTGEPDRLLAARSPWASSCRIQETQIVDGVARPVAIERGLPLPPGEVVELRPTGPHIILTGLSRGLVPGDSVPLTLVFAKSGELQLQVPVRQPLEADEPRR